MWSTTLYTHCQVSNNYIGGQILGETMSIIDEYMGVSQLLGARARDAPSLRP